MIQYLIFTCPECGSHELRRVEHSRTHFIEHSIIRKDGKYLHGEGEPVELESRGLAGLQCAKCMYPDSCRTSFRWKSWKHLETYGYLSPDPDKGKEEVACTIASLDGRFYRTHVMLKHGENLEEEQRRQLLERILQGQPGVVICERDRMEELPEARVRRKSYSR